MVRARSGSVFVISALVTLVLGVASSFASYQAVLNGFQQTSVVGRFFIAPLSVFRWPFAPTAQTSDYVAFAVGALILAVVAGLVSLIGARGASVGYGGSSVFLSTWFAVILAATLSKLAYLLLVQNRIMGNSPREEVLVGYYAGGISTSVYWGLMVGWIAGLLAVAGFKIANRKLAREATTEDDGWPLNSSYSNSGSTYAQPNPAPTTPAAGFTYPSGTSFEEPVPYGSANAYDAGPPQGSGYRPLSDPDVVSEQSQMPYGSRNRRDDEDPSDRTQQIPRN